MKGVVRAVTGEEFLHKVRSLKQITDVRWEVLGDDPSDPSLVHVVVTADGEEIKVTYPHPVNDPKDVQWFQNCCLGLILNKFFEQIGNALRVCWASDMANAVNTARKQLKA